ncbi:MAG TPA: nuclear transport factor 2 family protein [Candidatus Binatia bacterium]|nr:nuclear transport factor 2 family protein [Candidatus Binatia bacterium]
MILPEILTCYFDAVNRHHVDDASNCFTSDALVHDEGRDHVGRAAVRAWLEETTQKYHPKFEAMRCDANGDEFRVPAKVSGDFPGSPIDLTFDFTLVDGKIYKLIIG